MDTPDSTTLKRCSKCGELKPATREFFIIRGDGSLRADCRACKAKRDKAWRELTKDRAAETHREWYLANKDRHAENGRAWYEANKEHRAEYNKAHYEANKDRYAEKGKVRYEANREIVLHRTRARYEANKDRAAKYSKAWNEANPDKVKAKRLRRRVRNKAAGGTLEAADLKAIRAAQTDKHGNLICWRCGKPIRDTPHLDHWIPLSEGGTNDPGNLHYMHAKCNLTKHAKHPTEIGRLI
jgi:hypothetical protein